MTTDSREDMATILTGLESDVKVERMLVLIFKIIVIFLLFSFSSKFLPVSKY